MVVDLAPTVFVSPLTAFGSVARKVLVLAAQELASSSSSFSLNFTFCFTASHWVPRKKDRRHKQKIRSEQQLQRQQILTTWWGQDLCFCFSEWRYQRKDTQKSTCEKACDFSKFRRIFRTMLIHTIGKNSVSSTVYLGATVTLGIKGQHLKPDGHRWPSCQEIKKNDPKHFPKRYKVEVSYKLYLFKSPPSSQKTIFISRCCNSKVFVAKDIRRGLRHVELCPLPMGKLVLDVHSTS